MPSGVFDSILLKHLWGTEALRDVFNDENRVQKWFDFEAALALAQAELGIIPQAAADEIARKAKVENVDLEKIGAGIRKVNAPAGTGAARAAGRLRRRPRRSLHFGPTTQDVLDTGTVLQLREAHRILLRDLARRRARARSPRRKVQGHADGRAHPCGAGAADHLRPQIAIWLSETARNYERLRQLGSGPSSAAWSARSAPRLRSATAPSSSTPW